MGWRSRSRRSQSRGRRWRRRPRRPRRAHCPSAGRLVGGDRGVEEVAVGDGHALDRFGQEHVLRVDQVVAGVLRELVLGLERNRVERAGDLAVTAEDAAAEVDLVDTCVSLARRDPVRRRVLLGDDADAVGRARRGAERAADAFLEAVRVAPETVAAAEARVHGPLLLRVLLRDRLLEDLLQRYAEAPHRREGLWAHATCLLRLPPGKAGLRRRLTPLMARDVSKLKARPPAPPSPAR